MPFRIAIAGTGYIGAIHAQAVLNQPDAQIAAVITTKADGAAEFREKYHIPHAYASVEDLLRGEPVDGLIVCTPNALHKPQAIVALRARVPVLVEKPMAMNAAEAAEMQQAAEASGSPLMVAHCWRFDEEVRWLKGKVQSGSLGDIVRTKGFGIHTHWGPSGWFTNPALAGGGALVDMGIHAIDTTRFLIGDPQPVSVYARIGAYYTTGPLDDTGVIIINWDSGMTSYIESGWWQPHADGPESSVQLYGKKGFASLFPTRLELPDLEHQRVDPVDPGFTFPRVEHSPQAMYDRQMAYFRDCIQNGRTPVPGGREGWINQRITDAAYQSSRTGQLVTV